MIDPDMKKYAASELISGECMIWAEKVDQKKRDAWIAERIESDRSDTPLLLVFSLLFLGVGFIVFNNQSVNANRYVALKAAFPLFLTAILCFLAVMLIAKAYFNESSYYNQRLVGGYVLTNKRLLIFDLDYKLSSFHRASEIKWAKPYTSLGAKFKWKTTNLMLSPIGNGLFKFAELYFLHDFKSAELHINNVIKEHSHE